MRFRHQRAAWSSRAAISATPVIQQGCQHVCHPQKQQLFLLLSSLCLRAQPCRIPHHRLQPYPIRVSVGSQISSISIYQPRIQYLQDDSGCSLAAACCTHSSGVPALEQAAHLTACIIGKTGASHHEILWCFSMRFATILVVHSYLMEHQTSFSRSSFQSTALQAQRPQQDPAQLTLLFLCPCCSISKTRLGIPPGSAQCTRNPLLCGLYARAQPDEQQAAFWAPA